MRNGRRVSAPYQSAKLLLDEREALDSRETLFQLPGFLRLRMQASLWCSLAGSQPQYGVASLAYLRLLTDSIARPLNH
jgi:hypothetical protein